MTIAQDKVVTIHYKVVDSESGDLIDSSENKQPMVYLHGAQNIIPGLEKALEGKQIGAELDVRVTPEEAYGPRRDEQVQQVPRDAFKEMEKVEPGMAVTAQTEQGPVNLIVTEVSEATVTVDANHPLAGKTLDFSVKVESVRDASEEELQHGHVHGPKGHEH